MAKRKRRTKEEIEADNLAKQEAKQEAEGAEPPTLNEVTKPVGNRKTTKNRPEIEVMNANCRLCKGTDYKVVRTLKKMSWAGIAGATGKPADSIQWKTVKCNNCNTMNTIKEFHYKGDANKKG